MKLYRTEAGFHGTQVDAKSFSKDFEQVEVPTDKPGLIEFLNGMHNAQQDMNDHYVTVVERQDPPMDAKPSRPLQDLQEAFDAAPLQLQGELAVRAIDRMVAAQAPARASQKSWKQPDPMFDDTDSPPAVDEDDEDMFS